MSCWRMVCILGAVLLAYLCRPMEPPTGSSIGPSLLRPSTLAKLGFKKVGAWVQGKATDIDHLLAPIESGLGLEHIEVFLPKLVPATSRPVPSLSQAFILDDDHKMIPGAKAAFVKGVATEVALATNAKMTLFEQRHGLANIITCTDVNPHGFFCPGDV